MNMLSRSTLLCRPIALLQIINQPAQNLPNDHLIRDGQEKTTPLLLPLPDASRKVDKWLIINCDTHPMLTCNDISHIFIGWSIVFSKPLNDKNGCVFNQNLILFYFIYFSHKVSCL